jgi:glycosyltransferase involved in cell wall biosynthesis
MDQATPAVSVITIVKNNEKLLPRAIASVLGQTCPNFEYILINDGSTDATKDIIDQHAARDKRLLPVHLERNSGRAAARNIGLDKAKGRYIFFLDSDDFLPETALTVLHDTAEKDNADIVYARIKSFEQTTMASNTHHYTDDIINQERHNFRLDEYPELVNNHMIIGRLYRRGFLEEMNIRFSTTRKNGEDVAFAFYTAVHASSMSMIPEKIVYYYNAGNFLATANESKLFDARDNIIETLEFTRNNCTNRLIRAVQAKAAFFAGNLERARVVYGSSEKLQSFLPSLLPLVAGTPDEVLAAVSSYHRDFAKCLIAGDIPGALHLFEQLERVRAGKKRENAVQQAHLGKTNAELRVEIAGLQRRNRELAHRLDALYNSTSWRITRPLRVAMKVSALCTRRHRV